MGLVDVREVESGPQKRSGYEGFPPATTYAGQRDRGFTRVIFTTVVRDMRENFKRDPVHKHERVLQGPNQSEHFRRVSFRLVHPEQIRLSPIRSGYNPGGVVLRNLTRRDITGVVSCAPCLTRSILKFPSRYTQ